MGTRVVWIVFSLLLAACAGPRNVHPFDFRAQYDQRGAFEPASGEVQIQYLGTGGFYIRRGDDVVLTAPFWSNPSMLRTGMAKIRPNERRIRRGVALNQAPDAWSQVDAVLVGHAHYDHMLDLPILLQEHVKTAPVFGSEAVRDRLGEFDLDDRARPITSWGDGGILAARHGKEGTVIPVTTGVRVMALHSEHAPHARIGLLGGAVVKGLNQRQLARDKQPRRAADWPEGQTYAFLIDFLDKTDRVVFRILYQDAASNPPLGLPPLSGPMGPPVDLVIVCAPNFDLVNDYPDVVLQQTQPRLTVVSHWEDFFTKQPSSRPPRLVGRGALTKGGADLLLERIQSATDHTPGEELFWPVPGEWMSFCPRGQSCP